MELFVDACLLTTHELLLGNYAGMYPSTMRTCV